MTNKFNGKEKDFVTCYGFDPQASRDVGIAFYEQCSKTLANGTAPGWYCGVVIVKKNENKGI